MGDAIIITPQLLAIVSGIAALFLTVFGWIAKLFWNRLERHTAERNARIDRETAERNARMERERAELIARMDRERAELIARMESNKAEVIALIKQSDERTEKRFEQLEEKDKERDARDEWHHREIRAELRDLNTRVSRLEGRVGINDSSAGTPGQGSPRQNDDPAAAPEGKPDPAPVADGFDQSMVPLAGGRTEPQPAAGLAHQAVPDPQQGGETDTEPQPEDSPDAAR